MENKNQHVYLTHGASTFLELLYLFILLRTVLQTYKLQ